MKIGIIKFRKHEERILLNKHFIIDDLFSIILNDNDYLKFQIIDQNGNLLLSTHYGETGKTVEYLNVVKVKREEEILETNYNAYNSPQFVYKTKVTWTVSGGQYKTKKEALQYAERTNARAKLTIEKVTKTILTHKNQTYESN